MDVDLTIRYSDDRLCEIIASRPDAAAQFVTATPSGMHRKPRLAMGSCRCDGMLPLCSSLGAEDPQCGSGDEVALKVEGVVDRVVHGEETRGGSS